MKSAASAGAFLALGGHVVSASEFTSSVVGKEMDEGSWTWSINADGTHQSQATDGSWSDSGGSWEMRGDQYCRNTADDPEYKCSDVFMIGAYLRMGLNGELSGWTVKIN